MDATSQGVFADARFAPNYQRCSRIGAFRYRQEVNDPSSSNEVWRAFARGASSEHRLSLPLRAASRPTTTLTDKFEAYAIPKFASTAIFSHPCAISRTNTSVFNILARERAPDGPIRLLWTTVEMWMARRPPCAHRRGICTGHAVPLQPQPGRHRRELDTLFHIEAIATAPVTLI